MKKAAIYCRVSSADQASKDTSIPAQKKMLQKYAKEKNIQIIKEYIDAGFSAYKDIGSRKHFLEMIADAKSKPKPFEAVLYCYNDRVFRNMEDAVLYRSILRRKCNVELICITQDFDVNTPQGKLMERFMDALAEFDSASKGERIKTVMSNLAEKGAALGEPPYGYKIDPETGRFAVYEPEAEVVRYIYDEYIEGGSLRSIGVDLRTNGINMFGDAAVKKISKAVENKGKYNDYNLTWDPKTVRRKLINEVYVGDYRWDGEIIKNNHPAIVSREKYELANLILNKKTTTRKKSKDYLLKDLVKCYECGGSLSQLTRTHKTKSGGKKIYRKFRCSNHVRYYNCYYNYTDMKEIEEQLLDELRQIKEGKRSFDDLNIVYSNEQQNKIKLLEQKLEGFDEQFDRQMEAFQANIIDMDQLKKYKEKLVSDKEKIKKELSQLKNQKKNKTLHKKRLQEKIDDALSYLLDSNKTLQEKKNALKLIIEDIHISKKKDLMLVTFRI